MLTCNQLIIKSIISILKKDIYGLVCKRESKIIIWIIAVMVGIQAGGCGDKSVRLRPALTFSEHHADIFLDNLRSILKG